MSNRCFVLNCKSTVGAPFPRDQETKQKWLEGLQLTDVTPKPGSFICFAHFDPTDIKDNLLGTRPLNRLKRGAIPCCPKPVENEETNSKPTIEQTEEQKQSIDDDKDSPSDEQKEEKEKSPEVEEICRACMGNKEVEVDMFDLLEDDVTVSSAFMMCVFPVNVSKTDNLPKHICKTCLDSLTIAYKFQKKCIQTDDILRARFSENTLKRRAEDEESDTVLKKKDRKDDTIDLEKSEELLCKITDVGCSDNFEFIEDDDKLEDQEYQQTDDDDDDDECKDETNSTEEEKIKVELVDSELNMPTRRSRRIANNKTSIGENLKSKTAKVGKVKGKIDIDEIEKNLEEIHGQNATEVDDTEESVSNTEMSTEATEEESHSNTEETTVEDILNTLEEGNIPVENENILNEFLKKKESSCHITTPHVQKKLVVKSKFPIKINKDVTIKHIKLPKDIKIKPVQQYVSNTGRFPSVMRTGVYESCFLQGDDYLFEFGLVKGSIRHLRCVIPTCSAHGKQKILENGEFSETVEVIVPHNHQAPNEATKKKQMFLCVMRKKMQTDRTLNIRHIYEDACLEDPDIKQLVPLRNVINEICRHQLTQKIKPINSFEGFYCSIESDPFEKLHFTHNNQQFYQEKFYIEEDASMAILFGNMEVIQQVSESKVMYVDASFKIDTDEDFKYQLVTVLVWIEDSYYPIVFAIVNKKSQFIFRKIFSYLRDDLAPGLRPQEIITDYEANLYYALAEVYIDSNIGGSVFYYTQNLYKKICSLNLSRDLETNSYFRNIYHMLLMLPLLPVNTINDGLNNIHLEATNFNIQDLTLPLFDHVRNQWILNVTPELFCVHKLENRINENVIAPFKKLRDFLLLTKGKLQKTRVTIVHVIEKIIELEAFLRTTYSKPDKKSFGRDLSSFQKKNVLRAWQFIEDHPKIEINNFFSKVLGYIKCMENQLWIWGFYRYDGDTDDILINASHFSILSPAEELPDELEENIGEEEYVEYIDPTDNTIVMDAVIDQDGVLQTGEEILTTGNVVTTTQPQEFETAYIKYVYQ